MNGKTIYTNGVSYKFNNRRVTVVKQGDGVAIEMIVVDGDTSPRSKHTVYKNKAVSTRINLTKDGALAMISGLINVINNWDKTE